MSESQSNLESAVSALRAEINLLRLEVEEGKDVTTHPNTASEWYPSQFVSNFSTESYSFRPTIDAGGTTITVEAGDVVLGPGTWKEIAESTPAVTSTNTHVWLEIKVDGSTTPVMQVGTKAAMMSAMTSSETTMAYPLIETIWASGKITKARRLLDAIIPRAAG